MVSSGRWPRAALAAAACTTGVVLFLLLPRAEGQTPTFDAPRENVTYVLSKHLGDGTIGIPLRHYASLPPSTAQALTPRDAALRNGRVVPQDFAGTVALYAALSFIWPPLVQAVLPVAGGLAALFMLRIASRLDQDHADRSWPGLMVITATVALWVANPGVAGNASMVVDASMPSAAFLMAAVERFIRFQRQDRTRDLVLMVAFLGIATTLRYPSFVFAVPLLTVIAFQHRLTPRRLAAVFAVAVPCLALILVFNGIMYGHPLHTGYDASNALRGSSTRVLMFDAGSAFRHLVYYVRDFPHALGIPLIGLLVGVSIAARRRDDRTIHAAIVAAGGVLLIYHLGLPTWGSQEPAMNASFIRYELPVIALGIVYLAIAVGRLHLRLFPVALPAVLLVSLFSANTAWAGPYALRDRRDAMTDHMQLRQAVLQAIPPDAVVATRLEDRTLFPYRQTLTLRYLVAGDSVRVEPRAVWGEVPTAQRFTLVAKQFAARRIPLYLLDELSDEVFTAYRRALSTDGFELKLVRDLPGTIPDLYQVTPADQGRSTA